MDERLKKFGLKIEQIGKTKYSLLVDEAGLFHLNPWNQATHFDVEQIEEYTKALENGTIIIAK